MTQIVGTEGRGKFCRLTQFGNDLPDAAFSQWSALPKKEMPIRPAAPSRHGFSPDPCPFAPALGQILAMG